MKVTDCCNIFRNKFTNLINIICRCNRLTQTPHPTPHVKRPKFTNKIDNKFGKLNLKFRNSEN